MRLAFFLNEYRPYGGMPRDCVRLARACAELGAHVTIVTRTWLDENGALKDGDFALAPSIEVVLLGKHGWTNRARDRRFIAGALAWAEERQPDLRVGFLRMPGLDYHFACDPCFLAKALRLKQGWRQWTPRFRELAARERLVFERGSRCKVLLLHGGEVETYRRLYQTEPERLRVLPPGIQRRTFSREEQGRARAAVRKEFGLPEEAVVLLLAGSGFRAKGLDRALAALAETPQHVCLLVAGQDKDEPFRRLAQRLGVQERVRFLGGRGDVDRLMLGADVLVHPAYSENTGTVLVEALVLGLPVVCAGICGFATHVRDSGGGVALGEPFSPSEFVRVLNSLATDPLERQRLGERGVAYGASTDLYSCHRRAAEILTSRG